MITKIEELNLEQIQQLDAIIKWKAVDNHQVAIMESYLRMLVDVKAEICRTCPSQIRLNFQRITGWVNSNQSEIEQRRLKLEQELIPKICIHCRWNKIEDRRKDYCSPACKKEAAKNKIKK